MPYSKVLLNCNEYLSSELNTPQKNEDARTDTISSDTPEVDFGVTITQFFNRTITEVTDVFGKMNERAFTQTLQDNIRKRGVMQHLATPS
jgi:hypothetical protein